MGADRRAAPVAADRHDRRELGLALGVGLALWLGVHAALLRGGRIPESLDPDSVLQLANATTAVAGVVVALLTVVRWRLTGETRPLWIGAAALLLGPVAAFGGTLLPSAIGVAEGAPALRRGARLVAVACLAGAALWPEIDTRMRPGRVTAGAVALAATIAAAFAFSPTEVATTGAATPIVLTAGWAFVAWSAHRQYRRADQVHMLSVAVAASLLALGETVWAAFAVTSDPALALTGATALQATALVVLVSRGIRDLETAFVVQRERLLETEITAEIERVKDRARQALDSDRVHDANNSLMAIQGAALLIDRLGTSSDADRTANMIEALGTEVTRLRGLVSTEVADGSVPFEVSHVVGRALRRAGAAPLQTFVEVDPDLVAMGRPGEASEVVVMLLGKAAAEAPGVPVTVRALRDGGWIALYVEDRGQGIAAADREGLFEPPSDEGSEQSALPTGHGLTLYAARQLMRDQGGDLWVDQRPGGGSSFGLCWPAAAIPTAPTEPGAGAAPAEEVLT